MTRPILIIALILSLSTTVSAQSLSAFKSKLSQKEISSDGSAGTVTVHEYGDAADAVRNASEKPRARIKGYKVGVFSDNGQNARSGAFAAKAAIESAYPDVRVTAIYDTPYYKVSAGDCVTSEEAIILLSRIRCTFPNAYLIREDIAVSDLVR